MTYNFANGGRFGYSDSFGLGARQYIADYPFWSAARLPTGEVALVRPPNIEWPVWNALGEQKLGVESLASLRNAPYSPYQRPSVLIFNDATQPTKASGYLMSRAMETDSRVVFEWQTNEVLSSCAWQPAGDALPWYSEYEGQFAQICDVGTDAFSSTFPPSIAHGIGDTGGILAPFYAAYATLRPLGPLTLSTAEVGLPSPFSGMIEQLNAGEEVQVALHINGDGDLGFAPDPRVLEFHSIAAIDAIWSRMGFDLSADAPAVRAFRCFGHALEKIADLALGRLSFGADSGANVNQRKSTEPPIAFRLEMGKSLRFPPSPLEPAVPISFVNGMGRPDFERLRVGHKFSDI